MSAYQKATGIAQTEAQRKYDAAINETIAKRVKDILGQRSSALITALTTETETSYMHEFYPCDQIDVTNIHRVLAEHQPKIDVSVNTRSGNGYLLTVEIPKNQQPARKLSTGQRIAGICALLMLVMSIYFALAQP